MRNSERALVLYFGYTSILAVVLPLSASHRAGLLAANAAILASLLLLARAGSAGRYAWLDVLRDWYPLALLIVTYRQMAVFARPDPEHRLEEIWVAWDRALLAGGLRPAVEILDSVVPALLEIAYASFYVLAPAALILLYRHGGRRTTDRFLYPVVVAMLLCYAQFPWWPSTPPRKLYPEMDLPAYSGFLRSFNWWYLEAHGIPTSVFPSAHVAGAFGGAFGMAAAMPERPWAARVMLGMAFAIALATVYGRYHYFADAAAGAAMALIAMGIARARAR